MNKNDILDVRNVQVVFPVKNKSLFFLNKKPNFLQAVKDVSFKLRKGEILGIVGESGCGKSTLARTIMGLIKPNQGELFFMGKELNKMNGKQLRNERKNIQMIFQDPLASLDPRMTIGDIIAEPLKIHFPTQNKQDRVKQVKLMMEKVGLLSHLINRYPHEFSGGQCQRIGIARALILEPKLIICDEPVSALDVSIQAQIVNLLKELQKEMNLSLIFIAHDLSIIKYISDKILVMYLGQIVERGEKDLIFNHPLHEYTKALISAVPIADPIKEKNKKNKLLEGKLS